MIYAVIIAGGRGERFWPFSTKGNPKQLLRIFSDRSMLEETLDRIGDFVPPEQTLIVTGELIRERILSSFTGLTEKNILAEPFGKNTCLAIGLAAAHLHREDPEAIMVVLSADHYIKPKERLLDILRFGAEIAAREDVLITIGITPTRPETGYGYIEIGEQFDTRGELTSYRVRQFREKPNRTTAQQYYVGRMHMWNSGMFVWSAKSILNAIKRCKPEMYEALMIYSGAIGTPDESKARLQLFEGAENVSIDVAVLEEATNVVVIKGDLLWDDIGSWLALERISPEDKDNNVVLGEALLHDTYEVTAVNSAKGVLTTLGVSDLVIVRTEDVVLVAHKTRIDDIKELLARMRENPEYAKHL